jgi:hypothetical protein
MKRLQSSKVRVFGEEEAARRFKEIGSEEEEGL